MRPKTIKTRNHKGEIQRQCIECGTWTKFIKGKSRCNPCNNAYRKKYPPQRKKGDETCAEPKPEHFIDTRPKWLFEQCTSEQQKFLEKCDVEGLLEMAQPERYVVMKGKKCPV